MIVWRSLRSDICCHPNSSKQSINSRSIFSAAVVRLEALLVRLVLLRPVGYKRLRNVLRALAENNVVNINAAVRRYIRKGHCKAVTAAPRHVAHSDFIEIVFRQNAVVIPKRLRREQKALTNIRFALILRTPSRIVDAGFHVLVVLRREAQPVLVVEIRFSLFVQCRNHAESISWVSFVLLLNPSQRIGNVPPCTDHQFESPVFFSVFELIQIRIVFCLQPYRVQGLFQILYQVIHIQASARSDFDCAGQCSADRSRRERWEALLPLQINRLVLCGIIHNLNIREHVSPRVRFRVRQDVHCLSVEPVRQLIRVS